jgi:hypothetical protein
MSEDVNRRTVERWIEGVNDRDQSAMNDEFTDDSEIVYPQSGEVIRGSANRRAVYAATPNLPKITPYRTVASGDIVVTEAIFDYDGDRYNTVLVFECRAGKIARETAYWTKPFLPAQSRAPWVEMQAQLD